VERMRRAASVGAVAMGDFTVESLFPGGTDACCSERRVGERYLLVESLACAVCGRATRIVLLPPSEMH
jgi:hypothetical protein